MNMKLITGLLIVLFLPSTGVGMHKDIKVINQPVYIQELVAAWEQFLQDHAWRDLTKHCSPINVGCGIVYDLPNFLDRPNECFAIVDMGGIQFAEPHYHPDDNFEIYFVLQGTACVVVGHVEQQVKPGDVVVIPPNKAHFTIPDKDYVIACVNTPPYKPEHYIAVNEANAAGVEFDREQFNRLVEFRFKNRVIYCGVSE